MNNGHNTTDTSDENYDLISVLYHALQGAEEAEAYAEDAEDEDDEELTQFFVSAAGQHRQLAQQAKALLKVRLAAE